jgi:hypothetical protein
LIVAKDQGVLEVKNLDTWKAEQTCQQSAQSLNKNHLDYHGLNMSSDFLMMALNDKDKTI